MYRGTVCSNCYALRGMYQFSNVKRALENRYQSWLDDPAAWERSMVRLIAHYGAKSGGFFRWHDSGDLQSLLHLEAIARTAAATPSVRHWLPTREAGIVSWYLSRHGAFPQNLVVRLSDSKVGQPQSVRPGLQSSGVHTGETADFECPAYLQGGHCATCRACWNPAISRTSYRLH